MPDIRAFPQYFRAYRWDAKHRLYGYPPDEYQEFHWIASLEARFLWLRAKHSLESTASIYLLKEMIQWGGSQNGVLQKFEDGLGEVNLYELLARTIGNLGSHRDASTSALQIPGMGLTYASKLLRFLDPERYGALDSRVR